LRARIGPFWRFYNPPIFSEKIEQLDDFIHPFIERALAEHEDELRKKEELGERTNFTDSLSLFTKDKTILRDQLVSTYVRRLFSLIIVFLLVEILLPAHYHGSFSN
jgi:hypothetical protein